MVTDASTWNVILLSTGVIWNTGTSADACAPTSVVKRPNAARHKIPTCQPTAYFADCTSCLILAISPGTKNGLRSCCACGCGQHARHDPATTCAQHTIRQNSLQPIQSETVPTGTAPLYNNDTLVMGRAAIHINRLASDKVAVCRGQ